MGRRSHKRIIAIIANFDKNKFVVELDKDENIIDKNKLENIRVAAKYQKLIEKENYKKLLKENKKKGQFFLKPTNKTTQKLNKQSIFDDLSFDENDMKNFFCEFEQEHSVHFSNMDVLMPNSMF